MNQITKSTNFGNISGNNINNEFNDHDQRMNIDQKSKSNDHDQKISFDEKNKEAQELVNMVIEQKYTPQNRKVAVPTQKTGHRFIKRKEKITEEETKKKQDEEDFKARQLEECRLTNLYLKREHSQFIGEKVKKWKELVKPMERKIKQVALEVEDRVEQFSFITEVIQNNKRSDFEQSFIVERVKLIEKLYNQVYQGSFVYLSSGLWGVDGSIVVTGGGFALIGDVCTLTTCQNLLNLVFPSYFFDIFDVFILFIKCLYITGFFILFIKFLYFTWLFCFVH